MGVMGFIRRTKAQHIAKARGIDEKEFNEYYQAKDKKLGKLELQKMREREERLMKEKYDKPTMGERVKQKVRQGYKTHRANMKKKPRMGFGLEGSSGPGPQFGLNKDSSDIKVKKKNNLW